MKRGILLKKSTGEYYVHKGIFGPIDAAKVFFDFEEARKKAQETYCSLEYVEVRYKVLENQNG